ncbi:uncharacterized protein K444DRAFT_713024 [Hyaloscypha bicolor E]|uniref:2EXR domain-containing protein n=1 Tax=Hyaloscypha bicolor E TaxID=1095630 RepID=A0A2J6SEX8_9HELO|nr:uncharacterized protein K444DRAFT_713024 [Hyaloscypha bicolor E]PMD49321.1 hypothetical protein K444DRAFT_713024 [Hyaloscypha bicolor E]
MTGYDKVISDEPVSVSEQTPDNFLRFPSFPQQPPELRREVWKNASSVPRLVDLWSNQIGGRHGTNFFAYFDARQPVAYETHSRKPPAVRYLSKEAGLVSLESYSLAFGWEIKEFVRRVSFNISIPAEIYVHRNCDVICPMPTFASDEYGWSSNI